jgi:hypothetical protein
MVSSSNSSPNSAADQSCYAAGFTFSGSRHDGGRPHTRGHYSADTQASLRDSRACKRAEDKARTLVACHP